MPADTSPGPGGGRPKLFQMRRSICFRQREWDAIVSEAEHLEVSINSIVRQCVRIVLEIPKPNKK